MKEAYIVETGVYLPERVLTNKDLEALVDTNDEWIVTRTGIKERRIARSDEFTSDMGVQAAKNVLRRADFDPKDIDVILVATLTPDYMFPSTACLIQSSIGAVNAAAFDMQAACSGWIYALSAAKGYIASGMYKNILVIASEKLSSILDYKDRSTCVLFGDGAAACLVSSEPKKRGLKIGKTVLGSDGTLSGLLELPAGGCRNPATLETVNNRMHYLKMDGKEVFKHAVRRMEKAVSDCMEEEGAEKTVISHFVPHQANERIIEALAKRCGIEGAQVVKTLHSYGNTSASSVGIALDQLLYSQGLKKGSNLLMVAFGAGLTWGSMILHGEEGWS